MQWTERMSYRAKGLIEPKNKWTIRNLIYSYLFVYKTIISSLPQVDMKFKSRTSDKQFQYKLDSNKI